MLNLASLNQRVNALTAKINTIIPGGENLANTLSNGNSAGTSDIDMNNQDILQVDNINLVTVNGAAYPPASSVPTLDQVLNEGYIAVGSSARIELLDSTTPIRTNVIAPNSIQLDEATTSGRNFINSAGMSMDTNVSNPVVGFSSSLTPTNCNFTDKTTGNTSTLNKSGLNVIDVALADQMSVGSFALTFDNNNSSPSLGTKSTLTAADLVVVSKVTPTIKNTVSSTAITMANATKTVTMNPDGITSSGELGINTTNTSKTIIGSYSYGSETVIRGTKFTVEGGVELNTNTAEPVNIGALGGNTVTITGNEVQITPALLTIQNPTTNINTTGSGSTTIGNSTAGTTTISSDTITIGNVATTTTMNGTTTASLSTTSTAVTKAPLNNSTAVATTAYVDTAISVIPVPNLSSVMAIGNSVGSNDLNMNTNDILSVGNINLSTINSAAYPPTVSTPNLSSVMAIGNSVGSNDLNMNTNDITNCSNINLSTINNSAYPPVVSTPSLSTVLSAGNTANNTIQLTDGVVSNLLADDSVTLTDNSVYKTEVKNNSVTINIPTNTFGVLTQMIYGTFKHIASTATLTRTMNLLSSSLDFVNTNITTGNSKTGSFSYNGAVVEYKPNVTETYKTTLSANTVLLETAVLPDTSQTATLNGGSLGMYYSSTSGTNFSRVDIDTFYPKMVTISGTATTNEFSTLNHSSLFFDNEAPFSPAHIISTLSRVLLSFLDSVSGLGLTISQTGLSSTVDLGISASATKTITIGGTATTNVEVATEAGRSVVLHLGDGINGVAGSGVHINNGVNSVGNTQINNGSGQTGTINIGNATSGTTTTNMKGNANIEGVVNINGVGSTNASLITIGNATAGSTTLSSDTITIGNSDTFTTMNATNIKQSMTVASGVVFENVIGNSSIVPSMSTTFNRKVTSNLGPLSCYTITSNANDQFTAQYFEIVVSGANGNRGSYTYKGAFGVDKRGSGTITTTSVDTLLYYGPQTPPVITFTATSTVLTVFVNTGAFPSSDQAFATTLITYPCTSIRNGISGTLEDFLVSAV